jgi:hypothetical protein
MTKKPTPQDLWTTQMLEFLHQYFIGISNLTCSEEFCPLVENWNYLEKKLTYQGQAALYLISLKDKQWIPVDLISYEENDLGGYSEVEIKLKSGKTYRMKPEYETPELTKVSGYSHKPKPPKEIFLKEAEVVLFFNNSSKTPNLEEAQEIYLNDLWNLKEKIKWDQEKSKKKVFLHVENDPGEETQARKIDAAEKDYLFYIANPGTTNEIKKMEIYSPSKGPEERNRLYQDYKEEFSELRRVYGIRHLTSKKEDRQNNPEIELNEAQFVALERDKYRERMKSIKDFESKGGCSGKHTLSYGGYAEHQETLELEEAVQEKDPVQALQNQWADFKKTEAEPKKNDHD